MKLKTTNLFVFLMCLISLSCAKRIFPLPENGVSVCDDKIYINGKVFAELRYFVKSERINAYKGIAIYYNLYDKEVWIYPKEGWRIAEADKSIDSIYSVDWRYFLRHYWRFRIGDKPIGELTIKHMWCGEISISDDGKYIYYSTPGFFSPSKRTYKVEYGKS